MMVMSNYKQRGGRGLMVDIQHCMPPTTADTDPNKITSFDTSCNPVDNLYILHSASLVLHFINPTITPSNGTLEHINIDDKQIVAIVYTHKFIIINQFDYCPPALLLGPN